MAKGSNQKLKLMCLAKLFYGQTDEEHALTMPEIIERLAQSDISADRKTLYQDFEELRRFGIDIISEKRGHSTCYYLGAREFELPELKLLVDSVQSAKFITDKKSRELIGKLEGLINAQQARQLHRQVIISGRVKTMNESIYYNIDKLHAAINAGKQIRFQYYQWNVKKEMELRRKGAWYQASPWRLVWDDENYYLIAYDAYDGVVKHFRIDKMLRITLAEDQQVDARVFADFDVARYAKSLFGMYGGEETSVTLECDNAMANILIDRFGKDIPITPIDDARFEAKVTVAVSPQFFGWIVGLGRGVRITAPQAVVKKMQSEVKRLAEQYGGT